MAKRIRTGLPFKHPGQGFRAPLSARPKLMKTGGSFMQFSILGRPDDRDDLNKWFAKHKGRFERQRSVVSVLWTTFYTWLGLLLFLFLLFAYRPLVSTDEAHLLNGVHVYRQYAGEAPPPGQMVPLDNQYSTRRFTEYLSRTLGLIPPTCSVSAMSIQVPPADQPAANGSSAAVSPPDNSAPPFPLFLLLGEEPEKNYRACRWRNEGISVLAVLSPTVGSVQKLTFFLLILGLVMVRRGALQLNIDAVCFPGRAKSIEWRRADNRENRMLVHPVMTRPGNPEDGFHPLFPTENLSLSAQQDSNGALAEYRNDVYIARRQMDDQQLQQPFDLILQVLDTGIKHRRVGPMTDRLASASFDFRTRVSDRLWAVDYILWFLPTIGFLGTIYGISVSLVRAKGLFDDEANFSSSIRQVVDGLGVAFDTTSMALACSAILFLSLRRTEAKIGPLVDRAEETLTELLVNRLEETVDPWKASTTMEGANDTVGTDFGDDVGEAEGESVDQGDSKEEQGDGTKTTGGSTND